MAKPAVNTTGIGGPCIVCREYIYVGEGGSLIRNMEDHYLANHTNKPARHPLDKPNKRVNLKPESMFDRDLYLKARWH